MVEDHDAIAAGIDPPRLISNDSDPAIRYVECRALAADTEAAGGVGIRSPSAALTTRPTNLVVFGEPLPATWEVEDSEPEPSVPYLNPDDVIPVP